MSMLAAGQLYYIPQMTLYELRPRMKIFPTIASFSFFFFLVFVLCFCKLTSLFPDKAIPY